MVKPCQFTVSSLTPASAMKMQGSPHIFNLVERAACRTLPQHCLSAHQATDSHQIQSYSFRVERATQSRVRERPELGAIVPVSHLILTLSRPRPHDILQLPGLRTTYMSALERCFQVRTGPRKLGTRANLGTVGSSSAAIRAALLILHTTTPSGHGRRRSRQCA
ncbi:hypothetical protein EDD16DRAFT_370101 [Pisolithus croceorrhizus]|nr:hypothetical protein EDD16DRAFT_370101 [Pisolithus croceorrhizus]